MNNRLVTVFGGTGFLGRAVARRLLETGARVRIAARRPEATGPAGSAASVEHCTVDVRDEAEVHAALAGASAAVNAVSLYVEGGGLDFHAIHVEGAERVARLARDAGLQGLAHISGIGVDASSPSPYVRARALGEQRVAAVCPGAAVLRPSVLFGPGDSFLRALDAVTRLPVIPLFGNGSVRLQPVYVDDVARAVAVALESGVGGVFELGGADILSYRAILEAVLRQRGRRRVLLPVPYAAWRALATVAGQLPSPPLTRDQVVLMQTDNVVGTGAGHFADLGIQSRGVLNLLPVCLP